MKFISSATLCIIAVLWPSLPCGAQGQPSKSATSVFIAQHLPETWISLSFAHGKYQAIGDGCTLSVNITWKTLPDSWKSWYLDIEMNPQHAPTYFILDVSPIAGAAFSVSESSSEDVNYISEGQIKLADVDITALGVHKGDPDGFATSLLSMSPKGAAFPYSDENEANRTMRAISYLAKKCGAKEQPF